MRWKEVLVLFLNFHSLLCQTKKLFLEIKHSLDPNEVYASSNRMKINMVAKVRDYKKKEAQSIKDAALLVLTR